MLGYALLMFRWFFVDGWMRPRLLATLATHTLVVPLLLVHLAVLSAAGGDGRSPLPLLPLAVLVVQYWAAVFAWEIARKIRAPRRKTTTSRTRGGWDEAERWRWPLPRGHERRRGRRADRPRRAPAGRPRRPVRGLGLCGAAYVRFLARPVPANARLGPVAEAFSLLTCAWGLVA